MFCPECDAILVPKKDKKGTVIKGLKCLDCDFQSEKDDELDTFVIKDEVVHELGKAKIEVVENPVEYIGISRDIREELTEQYREALTD